MLYSVVAYFQYPTTGRGLCHVLTYANAVGESVGLSIPYHGSWAVSLVDCLEGGSR